MSLRTIPIRPSALRRRLAFAGLGAILAGATLGLCSPPANATPLSYLQSLNDHGIVVTDATSALTVGYTVCEALNVMNGTDVAAAVYQNPDITTPGMAAAVVTVAVEQLCPWHDHRGGQLA